MHFALVVSGCISQVENHIKHIYGSGGKWSMCTCINFPQLPPRTCSWRVGEGFIKQSLSLCSHVLAICYTHTTCTHTCTYMHTSTTYSHTRMHTHTRAYAHTCTYTHLNAHTHTHMHAHIHTHTHTTHMYTPPHTHAETRDQRGMFSCRRPSEAAKQSRGDTSTARHQAYMPQAPAGTALGS